ncbi:hypothetical protein SUDANB126_00166 [Streptomyces sp. enrichment culture]
MTASGHRVEITLRFAVREQVTGAGRPTTA